MRERVRAYFSIERKAVYTAPERQHDHRARAVHCETGRDLIGAGLKKSGSASFAYVCRLKNRKDRSNRNVHVEVRRTVEGVECKEIGASFVSVRYRVRFRQLFRGHPTERATISALVQHDVVRDHVEWLLELSLNVYVNICPAGWVETAA